jgi:cobalt-zinc-cadmium efflux system membrane fusion protein
MRRANQETITLAVAALLCVGGCGAQGQVDPKAEAPPPASVERGQELDFVQVERPGQFPLATAGARSAAPQLIATGVVSPDVSQTVPVVSLAAGRAMDVHARLGDFVKKGQLLVRIQSSDISVAFADFRKASADEVLAQTQFERATLLYNKGAISLNDLQVAQDAENKAKVDVETTRERLRLLGGNPDHPVGTVDVLAPVSGVIIEQNVTASAGVKSLDNSPNLFTIADLSSVWILCDVYENDLASVHLGETVEIRLNAYPDRRLAGRISNISPILDPNLRTAKVRIEVHNPGLMKIGMFVSATFHARKSETHAVVPSSAILHLHDRNWVYIPDGEKRFRRVDVVAGIALPNNSQEIVSGIQPGQRVVANALVLQSTVEQ